MYPMNSNLEYTKNHLLSNCDPNASNLGPWRVHPGNRRDVRTQAPHGLLNLCFWQVIEPDRAIVFHKASVRWSRSLITIGHISPEPTARWFPFPNAKADTAPGVRMESFNSGGVGVAVDVTGWESMGGKCGVFRTQLLPHMIESRFADHFLCYHYLTFYYFPITN